MKSKYKTILLVLVGLLLAAQLIPIDRSVPAVDSSADFLTAVNAPPAIATLVQNACYDCHSYQSEYPWYAKVAPVSFLIQSHINGGRQHLNFSEWTSYPAEKAAHKLEECFEEVQERHMPMKSFTWLHPEAKLSDEQVSGLAQWFQQLYRSTN
ncbi:heme-binding domain-containing protein [Lewinella sp. LCG006]|uniref:heme-binding domain-containing protein n=1 Tax=Lewinella sp. LCG006 TaxID=3231911 RepID=UPI003460C08A